MPNGLDTKRSAKVMKPPSTGRRQVVSIRQLAAAKTTVDLGLVRGLLKFLVQRGE